MMTIDPPESQEEIASQDLLTQLLESAQKDSVQGDEKTKTETPVPSPETNKSEPYQAEKIGANTD